MILRVGVSYQQKSTAILLQVLIMNEFCQVYY
jgi:hypothetical protein